MIRPIALAIALLMPAAIDGSLLAEVVPEVLIAEKKEELGLDDVERLTKEAAEAEEVGNYQKSIEILEQILPIEKQELGPEHADVAGTLQWLGKTSRELENYEDAETYFKRALAIEEKTLGKDHRDLAITLYWLGVTSNELENPI